MREIEWGEFIKLRVVDREAYGRVECDGCGACCASFSLGGDLLTIMRLTANGEVNTYDAMWFGQLTPTWREDLGKYLYSCSYLEEADDLQSGRCMVYGTRPDICRNFPDGRDGKAMRFNARCPWGRVEVFDFDVEEGLL